MRLTYFLITVVIKCVLIYFNLRNLQAFINACIEEVSGFTLLMHVAVFDIRKWHPPIPFASLSGFTLLASNRQLLLLYYTSGSLCSSFIHILVWLIIKIKVTFLAFNKLSHCYLMLRQTILVQFTQLDPRLEMENVFLLLRYWGK